MNIVKRHLPESCYSSRMMKAVNGAMVHFISAANILPSDPFNLEAIIQIFINDGVSAKYLIDRDGAVYDLVPGYRKSYHAGYSRMNGIDNCNAFTVGIELIGGTDWPYTDEQILALGQLLAQLMTENQFTLEWIQGHDKCRADWIAEYPNKAKAKKVPNKPDPGTHFPWKALKDMLYGLSYAISCKQNHGDQHGT